MRKRIFGVETEYGIIFTPEGRKTLPVEKAIRFLFEKLITTEHFLNVFLENGARFYQDTGCHPEYATPECISPRQLIIYDRAGERIAMGSTTGNLWVGEEAGTRWRLVSSNLPPIAQVTWDYA